jgi:hypothetical protein
MPVYAVAHLLRLRDGTYAVRSADYPDFEGRDLQRWPALEQFGRLLGDRILQMIDKGQRPTLYYSKEELRSVFPAHCKKQILASDRLPGSFDHGVIVPVNLSAEAMECLAVLRVGDQARHESDDALADTSVQIEVPSAETPFPSEKAISQSLGEKRDEDIACTRSHSVESFDKRESSNELDASERVVPEPLTRSSRAHTDVSPVSASQGAAKGKDVALGKSHQSPPHLTFAPASEKTPNEARNMAELPRTAQSSPVPNEEPVIANADSHVAVSLEAREPSQVRLIQGPDVHPDEPLSDPESYDSWNRALCEYFFSERSAGQPVYLDPEERVLAEICQARRWELDDPKAAFIEAVRSTIDLNRSNPFAIHLRNAAAWSRGGKIYDPPFVGLLAVFSMAAAAMVASEDYAAHNYYDRLYELLDVASVDQNAIQIGYRNCAEALWQFLNTWLDDWDGDRGRPTARSLDRRRYLSLAISQALVRKHDRVQLRKMFSFYDLTPGQSVGLLQMRQVLQHWFSSGHHASLARLWQRGTEFQDRISEIACTELDSWDGLSGDAQVDSSRPRAISVFAELRWHPVPSIDLSLVVTRLENQSRNRFRASDRTDQAGRAAIELASGEIRLEPSGYDDLLVLEPREKIRIGDALLASLDLAPYGDGQHLIHSGQPLLTLAYFDRYGAFREVANPQLLERLVVLAHQTLRDRVAQHLQAAARPGFKEFDRSRLRGLPEGWIAFLDVEIVTRIESGGLEALTPVSDWQLLLSGGIGLGRDTWHHRGLPEIKAAASSIDELELVLEARNDNRAIKRFVTAAIVPISDLNLDDGKNYTIALRRSSNSKVLARAGLRVRSADTARPVLTIASSQLAYLVGETGWSTISAQQANIAAPVGNRAVVGSKCLGDAPSYQIGDELMDMPSRIELQGENIEDEISPSGNLETRTQLQGSCILRGYHYWRFETVQPDADPDDLVRALCSGCGKTFWRTVRLPRRQGQARPARVVPAARVPAQQMPAAMPDAVTAIMTSGSISVEVLLDALCYMRVGNWQTFQTLAAIVDDSPVFAAELARTLVALGHIDLELDKSTLRPARWSVPSTSLVPIDRMKTAVAGWRSRALLARISELALGEGGEVRLENGTLGIPIVTINGIITETAGAPVRTKLRTRMLLKLRYNRPPVRFD